MLGEHLGPLLFQLPPNFKLDLPRFETFVASLPPDIRAAFEFRHDSWLTSDVYELLAQQGAALCIADFGDKTTPVKVTARHGYFRLRDEGYTPADLERWADELVEHGPQLGRRVRVLQARRGRKGTGVRRGVPRDRQRKGLTVA